MADTENKIAELTESLLKIDTSDYIKIQEVSSEIEKLKLKLDEFTMRWLELSE
jgi:ATP-binding cassette subfamily F protein uup